MASTTNVCLNAAATEYPIQIGPGLQSHIAEFLRQILPQTTRAMVVADAQLPYVHIQTVKETLLNDYFDVTVITIPGNEEAKTQASLESLYEAAHAFSLKRNNVVLALGGGIIGDLTGFFAATYMRGIPFVQMPTTLLAQVDASVGGKVAINWHGFKNMVGHFYHPKGVLIDTKTLLTLPENIFACGMAEVIKYAFLEQSVPGNCHEPSLLSMLQTPISAQSPLLEAIILRCCQLKAAVVEADPEERLGIRELLNLGHTFAHAYETLSHGQTPHGEAVALGMVNAFQLAIHLGQIAQESLDAVNALLLNAKLPLKPSQTYTADEMIAVMRYDKKLTHSASFRLVLPYETLGKTRLQADISESDLKAIL